MNRTALSLAALLALAPLAAAQDTAPAKEGGAAAPAVEKHVNKISEAAKAAFEAAEKLMYSPVGLGLKELTGTIEMKMEMEGSAGMPAMGMSFSVSFKAPREMTVGAKGGEMFGPGAGESMAKGVKGLVLNSMGLLVPSGDQEFDADLVTEDGKKVLILTHYEKNVERGSLRMVLGENGLPVSGEMVAKQEMMGRTIEQKGKIGWVFEKDGDLYRLQKQVLEVPMAPAPIEYRVEYSEAGGFKVPTKFVMDMGAMKFGYRFTELSVNGKPVALGEAKAAGTPTEKDEGGMEEGDEDGEDDGDEGDEDDGM